MTASPSYELIYFKTTGLAEGSRIILNLAGANWKETNPTDWPSLKPSMPFERIPILIERNEGSEDFVLSESEVIERYLARKYGFISSDPKLAAKQEQVRAQFSDARQLATEVFVRKNETHRQRLIEQVQLIVRKHEELLEKNGNNGHYFGDSVTYPDIAAYVIINALRDYGFPEQLTEDVAPRLNKLQKVVGNTIAAAKKQ
ncbi:hypothetical protein H4219_004313 [Mycoemilia scoparia]|uniref:Glutathione S-transferase n=1 Tax=Mycoemilia scoparia TaxID=417184 RepID=A0A9W7ZS32_9FUNG|nr:hypothetical protein H4219_004313 [Mycoemilia scoparia]